MKTLRSYLCGNWCPAAGAAVSLVDPSTEEKIALLASEAASFRDALEFARREGGRALRALTFGERGDLLKAMAKTIRSNRDELLELSRRNNGTTEADGAFDVDGASGTLAYYASLAGKIGERRLLVEGEELQLSRQGSFRGRHLWVPRQGVAIHINAFNFPAWGWAEKAACALLAGMPVITKPATATAAVAHRCVELIDEAEILPPGVLQMVCGSTGDLLDLLGPQDVLAFTGSSVTARRLRQQVQRQGVAVRVNVEADSLNAAVLGPDVAAQSATMDLFIEDVSREVTQKAGQKCTAVRRILAPSSVLDGVQDRLVERLERVVTGNPYERSVTMGPLATADQLAGAEEGVAALRQEGRIVVGGDRRIDGIGSPKGRGFFFAPTLLRLDDARRARAVHEREVFAPVATLMPFEGEAAEAAEIVARGGGSLVTSIYSDDRKWAGEFLAVGAAATGRLYVGSAEMAAEAPGSGVALPQLLHGGPGRAGAGEELGGRIGVQLYLQRLAVQGGPGWMRSLAPADPGRD